MGGVVAVRVYNRQEFLKLPHGTFYNKLDQYQNPESLCMKVKVGYNTDLDWNYQDFESPYANHIANDIRNDLDATLELMLKDKISHPLSESIRRDGCFDDKETFLVWEKADMIVLRDLLNKSIGEERND